MRGQAHKRARHGCVLCRETNLGTGDCRDTLAAAAFSIAVNLFFPLRSPARPSGSTFLYRPMVPAERYEAANVEKCLSAAAGFDSLDTLAALSRHPSTYGSTLGNDAGGVSDSPGSSVTWSRDGVRCRTTAYPPPSHLSKSITPLYFCT
jgi:hypothetical protein